MTSDTNTYLKSEDRRPEQSEDSTTLKSLRQIFLECEATKEIWGYSRFYEPLFEPKRHHPIRLMEIGVEAGRSMKSWTISLV